MAEQLPPVDMSSFKPLGSATTPTATAPNQSGLPAFDPATFHPLGQTSEQSQVAATVARTPQTGQSNIGAAVGTEPIKTSDIPLPSKDTTGGYRDLKALPMDWSGLKGLGKDLLAAGKGAVTGAVDLAKPAQDDTEKAIEGIGGPAALPIYRTLLGIGHTAKEATQIISAVKDINSSADPLGTYAKVLQKTSSQGAAQATLALATEGALKAAPKVANAASDLYKGAASKINSKYLQEPLQTAIRDVLDAATKTEPAPEPNYVYRSRDVGEQGIPQSRNAHPQATDDVTQAKNYADENHPSWRGK